MEKPRFSVLVRTFNSERTLGSTLECLANQSISPHEYIFVDSGSSDGTLDIVPAGSVVHKFIGREFNYSDALNQGLQYVSTEYVLIVSSHTFLIKRTALEFGLSLLASNASVGAAYYCGEQTGNLSYVSIDKTSFNGFNGLWNTCALIKLELLKRRQFRPDVFSAEDQEWAKWLFFEEGKSIARISGAGAVNANPIKYSFRKSRNEYVAVSYFVKRDLLGWPNICRILASAVKPTGGRQVRRRMSNVMLAGRLAACHFVQPNAT
jgi:glycosyltransferase involved in cell wall biosynthesis